MNFPLQHLPDIFRGLKFYIPDTVEKKDQLRRYIIAYPFILIQTSVCQEISCCAITIRCLFSTAFPFCNNRDIYYIGTVSHLDYQY